MSVLYETLAKHRAGKHYNPAGAIADIAQSDIGRMAPQLKHWLAGNLVAQVGQAAPD